MKKETIVEGIAYIFVTLFLYTAGSKLMDYAVVKEQIALAPLFAPAAGIIIILVPLVEILTAIALFFPRTRVIGLWTSVILMLSFTGYVIYIINYDDQLPCSCGGVLEVLSWPGHLILNGCLFLLLIEALYLAKHQVNQSLPV